MRREIVNLRLPPEHPKPSLRAKRSNPCHHAKKEWIASSQVLLAMTSKYSSDVSDRAEKPRRVGYPQEPVIGLAEGETRWRA
jgi:hypothetical protein